MRDFFDQYRVLAGAIVTCTAIATFLLWVFITNGTSAWMWWLVLPVYVGAWLANDSSAPRNLNNSKW